MDLEFEINKLDIQEGDTVVIKSEKVSIEELSRIHSLLKNGGLINVRIIKLNLNDDIQSLNEEQMNRAGWFRKNVQVENNNIN